MLRPRLRHEHGLHLEPGALAEIRRGEHVMAADGPDRHEAPRPALARVRQQRLELANLVSAVRRVGPVVALDPELAGAARIQ